MKRLCAMLLALLVVCPALFVLKAQSPEKAVLAKVGKESVTYSMLKEAYRKNMNSKTITFEQLHPDSLREFLQLYVNYRLKVQEAMAKGLHKKPEILNDIAQNRTSLAAPYMFERKLTTPAVDIALERRKKQCTVGLILSNIVNNDTLAAYQRSLGIIGKLKLGADFKQLAKDSTHDDFGKNEGGVYGPVTSFQMLREIEDFLYTAKPGDVCPKPIRTVPGTQPGYFVAKLLSIEPRVSVLGSQIFFTLYNVKDSSAVRRKADSVLQLLRSGSDFAALARTVSDDKTTAEFGGRFPAYYASTGYLNGLRTRHAKSVEGQLFTLEDGSISGVVVSHLGLHIIRRDSSKLGGDDREELKKFYKRVHFEADKQMFLEEVKKKNKLTLTAKTLQKLLKSVDTTSAIDSAQVAALPQKLRKELIFTIAATSYSVQRFADSLLHSPSLKGFTMNYEGLRQAIKRLSDAGVVETLTQNLEKEFSEFGTLMKEFHDGILIFRLEEQEIWNKMKFDTTKARLYHDSLKSSFMTEQKYNYAEIHLKDSARAWQVYKQLQAGADFDSLAAATTEREGFAAKKGRWGEDPMYANVLVNAIAKTAVGNIIAPIQFQGGYSIGKLHAIIPPRVKTFDEALPDFAAQFQDLTQKNMVMRWLSELRNKYPVQIDQKVIEKLWKRA